MDDQLQRRLRGADPLAGADGMTPDAAHLDAIKEQIMQTEARSARSALRPRTLGLTALTGATLAAVLVVGSLVQPTSKALAWDPAPVAATEAQAADAATVCAGGLPGPNGTPVTVSGDGLDVPALPPMPAELPALVHLELHGTGGVAIFSNDTVTAYCLLVKDGETLVFGGLLFPDLGNGAAAGVGTIGGAPGQGTSSGAVIVGADGFAVAAMGTTYKDQLVGIIAGQAPEGTATIKVTGGPADGATATVDHGRFALWAPGSLQDNDISVTALDPAGRTLGTQSFAKTDPAQPMVTETSKPKP